MWEKLKKWWTLDRSEEDNTADSVLAPVRWKQRRKAFGLISVSFGWGFCITGMFVGSQIANQASASGMIQAIIIGNLILFAIAMGVCIPAYRTGCTNSLMYRMVFGNKGWVIPCIVVVITGIGWNGSLIGMFPDVVIGAGNPGYAIVGLVGGILVLIACYVGIKGLEKVGNVALVFLCIAGIVCIVYNVISCGGMQGLVETANQPKEAPISTAAAIDAIVGSWAVGAMFAGDYTRFAKKAWVVWAFVGINFFVVQPFLQILGVTGAIAHGDHVFTNYARNLGMIFYIIAFISMMFAIWTTANSNMYFTQIQFANLTKKSMKVSCVILAVFGAICAAWGFFNYFGSFINFIVALVPPLLGPIAADFYICNKMKYDPKLISKIPAFNWVALISYVAGIVIPVLYTPTGLPVAIWNIVTAAVVYLVIFYICKAAGHKVGYSAVSDQGQGPWVPEEKAKVLGELQV